MSDLLSHQFQCSTVISRRNNEQIQSVKVTGEEENVGTGSTIVQSQKCVVVVPCRGNYIVASF